LGDDERPVSCCLIHHRQFHSSRWTCQRPSNEHG
jgi:hypothetical protein